MKNEIEQGTIRITTWNNTTIRLTDCEFAGKRGKECSTFTLQVYANDRSNQGQAFCDVVHNMKSAQVGAFTLADVKDRASAILFCELAEAVIENADVKFYVSNEKAVRVQPIGFEDIKIGNDNYGGSIGWEEFSLSDYRDQANLPRWISTSRTKKADFKKVYEFVKANLEKFNAADVTMHDAQRMIQDATGVSGHSYCGMD